MQRIRVGLNPVFGGLFFVVAAFNFYVHGITHDGMQLGLGLIMGVLGLLYSFGTYLIVVNDVVELKNPLGITMRSYRFESPHDLAIQDRKLWIMLPDGSRKKISGLVASGRDWRALKDAIANAKAERRV